MIVEIWKRCKNYSFFKMKDYQVLILKEYFHVCSELHNFWEWLNLLDWSNIYYICFTKTVILRVEQHLREINFKDIKIVAAI